MSDFADSEYLSRRLVRSSCLMHNRAHFLALPDPDHNNDTGDSGPDSDYKTNGNYKCSQYRFRRWRLADLTMANMKKFFGLCINMGLVRKKNVADYWAKNHPSTYVPFFATVMSLRLFAFISRVLHAGDPEAPVRG